MRAVFLLFSVTIVTILNGQVNLQNGSGSYDIPVYSFTDAKTGLGTSVSLNYSSGNGLLVNSQASNTGQNWNLVAGGSIIRKQNGEPDDQNSMGGTPYYFPTYDPYTYLHYNHTIGVYAENTTEVQNYVENYYPNGFMYSEFPNIDFYDGPGQETHLTPRELAIIPRFRSNMDKRWKMSRRALADRMQDVFMYNFNGLSGEFVIGRDGNPLLINDAKIIIEKSISAQGYGRRTNITEFTVKDVSGTIYKFSACESSVVMNVEEIAREGSGAFQKITSRGTPAGAFTVQKWLLTEIINPITYEKITFEYENYSIDLITDKTPSYEYTEGQVSESVQVFEQRSMGELKRLKNIILPDGHKVEFTYNTALDRVDVPGDHALSQIKILYNNEEVNSYSLGYGYFVKKEIKNYTDPISQTDKRFARLCLKSFQKSGIGITEPAYKFEYYTGSESSDIKDIVPPSDCVAQDHWGYYNKSGIVDNDVANPSKEVLKNLMLYNSTYRQPFPGAAKIGLLKSAENPFGGKMSFDYEQNDSKDSDNPSMTVVAGGVRVFKTTLSDGVSNANDIVTAYNYKLPDGTTSGWGYEAPTYLNRREVKIWNASNLDGYTQDGILKYDVTNNLTKFFAKQLAQKLFKAFVGKAAIASMGWNPAMAIAAIMIGQIMDRLFVLFNSTDYVMTNGYNFYPFESQNPIGINYSRVEILNISLVGGNGKTVSEFTAPANVRAEIPAFLMPYSPKQRFPGWKYGLPLKTTIYNQAGSVVKETSNTYNIIANTVNNVNHRSTKVEVVRPESVGCFVGINSNNLPVTDLSWEHFYPVIGRAELTSSTEKNYGSTGILSESQVNKSYNADFQESTVTVTKSNGDLVRVKTYYAKDYNNISAAIQEMKSRNILSVPISTETWLIKPNGTEYLIDATIHQFDIISTGEIKAKKVYKLVTREPLLKSIIGEQSPVVLIRNSSYFKEQLTYYYDAAGNTTETISPELRVSSKIYDHNSRFVTAEIINALQNEVAYTSFETTQNGGWSYNYAHTTTGDGITGRKIFTFPASSIFITKTLNSPKPYILSFWKTGTDVNVTNGSTSLTPAKTVSLPSGWTYCEYLINNPGTISIERPNRSSSPVISIDELRLYPKDARMATAAYDPKLGKIAECDANNMLLYYYYDGLSRLKMIKDERKNILKMLCYNYAGEAENCISSVSPFWTSTGMIRCKPCSINPLFYSSMVQHQEKDLNPASETYNQLRWVDDYTLNSCESNNWVNTGNAQCLLDVNGNNNGYQQVEQINANPCSSGYNSTNWVTVYNPSACPPSGGGGTMCNGVSCDGNDKKCINGVCETGTWSVVAGSFVKENGVKIWTCTWRYCFSDGSQSTYSQTTTGTSACFITCY